MKQLLLDISKLVQKDMKTGIQRVVWGVLQELLRNPPDGWVVEPIYASTDAPGYRYASNFMHFGSKRQRTSEQAVTIKEGDIFFGLDLIPDLPQYPLLKEWHKKGVCIQFLVHDLLPITMQNAFLPPIPQAFARWLKITTEFDGVVCVSRCIADEYYDWLQTYNPKRNQPFLINWSHNGVCIENWNCESNFNLEVFSLIDRFNLRPTFLMVGTIEPRKGHDETLQAFTQLWEEGVDINLVIVGKLGWKFSEFMHQFMRHPQLSNRLFWLNNLNDEDLIKTYSASTCLIAASLGEGFGLPLIEAAKYKLPIIARDIPIFHEVAGKHAYFFKNDKSPETLAGAITDWLHLYRQGRHPKSDNLPYLTWKESTAKLLNILMGKICYRQWPESGSSILAHSRK